MSKKEENLKKKVTSGMFYLVVRDFSLKAFSILGQLLLVRMVAPQYFGLFAIITFLVGLAELFGDIGLTHSIIQNKKKLSIIQINTIFWLKIALSLASILLLILCFPIVQMFYRQLTQENLLMTAVLSSTILIRSIRGISIAFLDKELNFNVISKIDLTGVLVYLVVAIGLAYYKLYLWNFIIAIVIKEIVELIMVFKYKPWRPILVFNLSSIKSFMKFGIFMQVGNFISFAESSTIPVVGFRLSPSSLGLLQWSSSVANLSNTFFENYGRVAFAGMVSIQDRKDKLSKFINVSSSLLNAFAFLFVLLVFVCAKDFVSILLPSQWLFALPSLYWFVASTVFIGGSVAISHAMLACGKSKDAVVISGSNVILEIIFSLTLLYYLGFTGIAVGSFFAALTIFVQYYVYARKFGLDIEMKNTFFNKFFVFILSSALLVVLLPMFKDTNIFLLSIKALLTLIIFIGFLYIFSKKEVMTIYKIFIKNSFDRINFH